MTVVLRSDQIFEGMLIRRLSWPETRRFRVREVGTTGLRGTMWENGHAVAGPNAFISWRPMDVPPSQRGFVIWDVTEPQGPGVVPAGPEAPSP